MNHRRNLETADDVKIRSNVYPEKSVADTCLRAAWHPGERWLDSISGDSTEHERLIHREVGKVQADKQQERKYERGNQIRIRIKSWTSVQVPYPAE